MNRRKRCVLLFEATKININPVNVKMAEGYPAAFYCGASGYNNNYSWEERHSGGAWTESLRSGSKSPFLKVVAKTSLNGCQYRCKVTNGGAVYYSGAAILTVVEVTASGTTG